MFQIHGLDAHGKAVLRKQLRRSEMARFFANLELCLIGMEACGGSHHWARKLGEFGQHRQAHVTPVRQTLCKDLSMTWRMQKRSVKR